MGGYFGSGLLVLLGGVAVGLFAGCDPKPLAELPSLDGEPRPAVSDRDVPGGRTLAAALDLLDPRVTDPADLDRRRDRFVSTVSTLVPDPKAREEMGFERLVRWHYLYARRVSQQARSLDAHRAAIESLLQPRAGSFVEIDEHGLTRVCQRTAAAPPAQEPPAKKAHRQLEERRRRVEDTRPIAEVEAIECKPVQGAAALRHQVDMLAQGTRDIIEAEWYLLGHIGRLRARLDPGGALSSLPDPPPATPGPGEAPALPSQ